MSVTVTRDGIIRPQQDTRVEAAMLPSACPQNHAANLLPLPDGSLMCVWFGGTREGIADISVWGSRLSPGSQQWSEAEKLSDDATRSEQNPVLFPAPDNVLWLLWTAQISGNQDTAIVRYRQSRDLGKTWGTSRPCSINPAPLFVSRLSCWRTGTGCCRCFTAAPGRVRNGSVTMTSAR